MLFSKIRYYLDGREVEWINSTSFVLLGLCVLIWPETTTAPAFRFFSWLLPHALIGTVLLTCGLLCITALLVNGRSQSLGPRVRAWTALIRAILLMQFWLSTVQEGIHQGFPYTVTPFWLLFAVSEIWVAYRAVLDVRTPD